MSLVPCLRAWMVLVLLAAGGCRDQFLLYPSRHAIGLPQGVRRVMVPWEHGQLEVMVSRSEAAATQEPRAFLLRFVGAGDRAENVAPQLLLWREKPIEAWTVNRPGFGGSEGSASADLMGPAALAAYDALAAQAGGRPILVWGYSIGGSEALCVASRRPVAGVILRNTPPIKELLVQAHGWWNLWLISGPAAAGVPPELDTLACARQSAAPAVFLMSDGDLIVPHSLQEQVLAAYAGPKRALTDSSGGHGGAVGAEAWEPAKEVLTWLWGEVGLR